MLRKAAKIVYEAHQQGLISILWIYPRGSLISLKNQTNLVAGCCGVGVCLGSDFIKIEASNNDDLKEAVLASGNTKIVCSGGKSLDPYKFLTNLYDQIHMYGTSGSATGRNIHQKKLNKAVGMCNAIASIVFENKSPKEAFYIYNKS